jgi:hypothetical protein
MTQTRKLADRISLVRFGFCFVTVMLVVGLKWAACFNWDA